MVNPKYLLKKALEPILPKDILYRSKKGFGVPIGSWFKSGAVALPTSAIPGFTPRCVDDRLSDHKNGQSDERAFLWGALTLASFIEKSEAAAQLV